MADLRPKAGLDSGESPEAHRPSIPLLGREEDATDLEVLRTWQEAVSDAVMAEVPHDLFALWLFTPDGAAILIGPEALAQDHLAIPRPDPTIDAEQLRVLEEVVAGAGYGSTLCMGIRHGHADVGLLLLADLRPGRYDSFHRAMMQGAVRAMGPLMGRISRRWAASESSQTTDEGEARVSRPSERPGHDGARLVALFSALGQACAGASTPRDFLLAVSFALQPLLPHDHAELLVPDGSGDQCYRLGSHGLGPLWSDPGLVLTSEQLDQRALFAEGSHLLVRDALSDQRGAGSIPWSHGEPGEAPRSILGIKLRVLERTVGLLFLGSEGEDFFGESDLELFDHVGALIAPRVDSFSLLWHQQVLRSNLSVLRHIPMHLSRIAELLAAQPLLGEGTRLFATQAAALLPVDRIEFAVRLGDEQRVAIVEPGDSTPLADRPQQALGGTMVGQVIRGEVPYLLTEEDVGKGPVSVLVVPLRVAGSILGALAMTALPSASFTRTDMAVAQQLGDLIAPHLEVQRRITLSPPAFVPGWKRTPRF